jgi:hypothetical protein
VSTRLEKANQWLVLVTNIGIVAGFVLIALQLQQNTKALQIEAKARSEATALTGEIALMGENLSIAYAKAQLHPEQLVDSEIQQVSGYLALKIFAVYQSYGSYMDGLLSKDQWEGNKRLYIAEYNYPFARAFLTSVSSLLTQDFVAEMEQAYEANSGREFVHLAALKEALASELSDE